MGAVGIFSLEGSVMGCLYLNTLWIFIIPVIHELFGNPLSYIQQDITQPPRDQKLFVHISMDKTGR
jgi:hypothetical protein